MGDSNDDNGDGDGGDVDSKSNGDGDGVNKKHGYHSFAGLNGCPADVVRDDGQHGFVDHLMFDSSNLMVGEEVSAGTRRQHSHSSDRCDDDDHTAPSHRLDSKRHTDLYRDDDTDSDNEDGGEDDSDANTDAGNMVMGPHSSCDHSTVKSTHSMPTVTVSYLVTRLIRMRHENRHATNEMASMRHQSNGWNQEKERLEREREFVSGRERGVQYGRIISYVFSFLPLAAVCYLFLAYSKHLIRLRMRMQY